MAQRVGRSSARELTKSLLIISVVGTVLLALLVNGADAPEHTAVFALFVCPPAIILVTASRSLRVPLSCLASVACLAGSIVGGLAGNWHIAQSEILQLATGIILFTVGATCGYMRSLQLTFQKTFLVAVSAYCSLVLLLASLSRQTASDLFWDNGRLAGTFASPNSLAAYCAVSALFALSIVLGRIEYLRRRDAARIYIIQDVFERCFLACLALLCATICLLLTASRAGNLIFLLLATVMAAASLMTVPARRRGKTRKAGLLILILGIVLLVSVVALSGFELAPRLESLANDAVGRGRIYSVLIEAWRDRWMTGYGLGSMEHVIDQSTTLWNAASLVPHDKAHNVVLQWLVQTGVVGTSAAAILVGWMVFPSLQLYLDNRERQSKILARAVVFVFAFFFLHGQVDYALEIPALMWILALLLGLGAGAATLARSKEREENMSARKKSET